MHIIKFTTPVTMEYPLHMKYNDQVLNIDESVNFLGVCLDSHLKWNQYSENLIKKLSTAIFMLRKLQPMVSVQVLRMVYFSYVQAQLNYGIIFWGSSSSMYLLFTVQKKSFKSFVKIRAKEFI